MAIGGPAFDELARDRLLAVALETMHVGHLLDRALMPHVALAAGDVGVVDRVAIDEWMGASPVYTGRMRRLMGIEGDGVDAIMKALQLDVGFPHQYMDVGWKLSDAQHGEFWLRHCGALMDVEPYGEKRVVGMCHTIEDPTFDATAYATNPRARIRPIHRPPRVPADRHPHCHWTIAIDPANEPVAAAPQTQAVSVLPLADLPNERAPEREPRGRIDYRGAFDPDFRLAALSTATLAAVAREFHIQSHLLASSAELALAARFGADKARELVTAQWIAVAWVAGERLVRALGPARDPIERLAEVLRLHAALPPGFARATECARGRVRLRLVPSRAELLDPANPGWLGVLVRGGGRGLEALAGAVEPRARLAGLEVGADGIAADLEVDASRAPVQPPKEAGFMKLSTATTWTFDVQ
ncbi:MAG TPA: hypothetical protein VMH82_09560 [Myxococcota bacterium]|nr:hypothetical protein [Myxococcota bacterium]